MNGKTYGILSVPSERYYLDSVYSPEFVALYYWDALCLMRKKHLSLYKHSYKYVLIYVYIYKHRLSVFVTSNIFANKTLLNAMPHATSLKCVSCWYSDRKTQL